MTVSRRQGVVLSEIPEMTDLKQVLKPGLPYFCVELPTGERLFHHIQNNSSQFPIQLGRYNQWFSLCSSHSISVDKD